MNKEEEGALEEENELENNSDLNSNDSETRDNMDGNLNDIAGSCEQQDHSTITDELVTGFFIPDCALLTSVSIDSSRLGAYFAVEGGDWRAVFKAYKDFFGDALTGETQNSAIGSAELRASLYDDLNAYSAIQLKQGEESLCVRIIQEFPKDEE